MVKDVLAILVVFSITAEKIKGSINNSNQTTKTAFLNNYVKPYRKSLENNSIEFRTNDDIHESRKRHQTIKNYINDKISELKPYLQDDSVPADDDKLTLEGDDETTIIEILPKNKNKTDQQSKALREKTESFKTNIEKYKKLRRKIKKALKIENVTNKTRKMVTKTLDEMIAHIITNKCTWTGDPDTKTSILRTSPDTKLITNNWDQLWNTLKKQFISPLPEGSGLNQNHKMFMMKLQDLMDLMSSDLKSLVDKYKVVCQVTEDEQLPTNDNILRIENNKNINNDLKAVAEKELQGNDFEEKVPCDNFKVCSEELKEFMQDFYKKLNDTAVSTFTNYAEMFIRDVSDDATHEKERIYGLIKKSVKDVIGNVTEIFKNQTQKFKLDSAQNKYANMRRLYKYISKITESSKKAMHSVLMDNLMRSVRPSTMEIIEKDIISNADIDLGNLEREIGNRICPAFEVCNGKIFGKVNRRSFIPGTGKHNVYVKLHVNMKNNNNGVNENAIFRANDKTTTKFRYKSFKVLFTNQPYKAMATRTSSRTTTRIIQMKTSRIDTTTAKITTTPKIETTTPKIETTTPKIETTTPKIETTTPKIKTTTPKIETTTLDSNTTTLDARALLVEARQQLQDYLKMVPKFSFRKRSDARKNNKLTAKHDKLKRKSLNSILNELIKDDDESPK